MNKKKMVTVLGSATLIGAIGIGGSLAYLTAKTDQVSNAFTLGNGIKIDLKESYVGTETDEKDAEGKPLDLDKVKQVLEGEAYGYDLDGVNTWTVKENKYESVHPGETVYKDPTVLVAEGSEEAYIYATVKNASTEVDGEDTTQYQINVGDDWTLIGKDEGKGVLIYRHNGVGKANDNFTLFTNARIRVPKQDGNQTDAPALDLDKLDVKAYAVQAHGVKQDTADAEAIKFIKGN
ncbi:hypothetical protein [Lachnobacterium bovis]|uniref:hypothetical protein n=1 Tax=Lachnobacterium bovis TaxID=140626 RepID=UPI00048FB6C4|nr:hypothetical protein [Lachnobacterium bovis]